MSISHALHARRGPRIGRRRVSVLATVVASGLVLGITPGVAAPPARDAALDPSLVRRDASTGLAEVVFGSGRYLTGPSNKPPARVVLDYLAEHREEFGLTEDGVRSLVITRDVRTQNDGAAHLVVGQQVDGAKVHEATVTALVDRSGRLVLVGGRFADTSRRGEVRLTAGEAIGRSAEAAGAGTRRAPTASATTAKGKHTYPNPYARRIKQPSPVTAELVWAVQPDRTLRPAWLTEVEISSSAWEDALVDAETGAVVQRQSRYRESGPEGNVFREEHPGVTGASQQVTSFTGVNGSWVAGTTTNGNNVNAYLDRNDDDTNNEYQPNTPAQHFNYAFTDAWQNATQVTDVAALDADRDAVVTQMFYYTNELHDWLWGYGFDEASGNFQTNNISGNGTGGDAILAEAQDGWDFGCDDGAMPPVATRCRNNANFGTGDADGSAARMQMFVFDVNGNPSRDGAMDGDVIAHEIGHGVSNRLVPDGIGGGTDQSGSLGEGWSDAISFLRWGDAVVGDYATSRTDRGFRSSAYDTSTKTYASYDTGAGSPHANGEIWATMLYDIRTLLGIPITTRLVLDGMRSTASGPGASFLNARDGILAADMTNNGGANQCALWSAFAGRGLGQNAVSAGIHAAQADDTTVPAACLPTADAGGPYITAEGTDVSLTGSGAKGSDPSAGAIASYAWDLDNDGAYDDATGTTPTFNDVGQDGVFTVGLQVTDAFGNTATDTALLTVTNVAPTVVINAISPINEFGTVTVTGTISDPGWEDDLSATIDWDDGAGSTALTGTEENNRPNATLGFSVQHQYGDNGTFTVSVTGLDDDTSTTSTRDAVVGNLDPTAVLDASAEQVYDGVSAFVLEAGEQLSVPVRSTDPGSDDLTFTWDWDDGLPDSTTSLVNPPVADPAKSPSVQPRDTTLSKAHTFGNACVFNLETSVLDDDGGSASDTATVVVTGTADKSKGSGFWLNQYRPKSSNVFTPAQLSCYLKIAGFFSLVFPQDLTRAQAEKILNAPAKAPAPVVFDQQALAAWLNFANGAVKLDTPVDTDGNGSLDSTFGAAMLAAETVRINPASTPAQIRIQKAIVERIVLRDGG